MVNLDTNQTTCYVRDERCVLVLEIRRATTFLFCLIALRLSLTHRNQPTFFDDIKYTHGLCSLVRISLAVTEKHIAVS